MAAWLTYLRERFPLPVYVVLVGGFSLSGVYLGGGKFAPLPFLVSFFGLMIFFALLRLMDELKDFEKDCIAHPERPLPRGVLTIAQAMRAVGIGIAVMALYAPFSAIATHGLAGLCYLLVTGYLWLMYREFFRGDWLTDRPILYAGTHQLIVLPVCYYCVLVSQPALVTSELPLCFGLSVLGAFFAYEVCRKLDPGAHPVLKTYLSVYGPEGTFLLVLATMLIAAAGALGLGLAWILVPIEIALLGSLAVLWFWPAAFKIPETVATVSLVAHLWAIPLHHLWGSWAAAR